MLKSIHKALVVAFGMSVVMTGLALAMDKRLGHGPDPRCRPHFLVMDKDRNSVLSIEEYLSPIQQRMNGFDANADGLVSGIEIDAIFSKHIERMKAQLVARLDVNGDGKITTAENQHQATKRFAALDRNDSGDLDIHEISIRGKPHAKSRPKHSWMRATSCI